MHNSRIEELRRRAQPDPASIEIQDRVGDYSVVSHDDARDDRQSATPPAAVPAVTAPAPVAPPPAAPAPLEPGRVAPAPTPITFAIPRPAVPLPAHVSPAPAAAPPCVPHPGEAALSALEAFLAAIRAAKATSRQPFE